MKFTVDRKTWYRGKGTVGSRLLTSDSQRCCIGFVAQQCGLKDVDILYVRSIYGLHEKFKNCLPDWTLVDCAHRSDTDIYRAYRINDDPTIVDEEREMLLKKLFRENGDEIEFVN